MLRSPKIRASNLAVIAAWVIPFSTLAGAQTLQRVATGSHPGSFAVANDTGGQTYVLVSNSGDNSISVFKLDLTPQAVNLTPAGTISGIPAVTSFAVCNDGQVLVTSAVDGAVRLLSVPQGQVIATMQTGREPTSAACFRPAFGSFGFAISNRGDSNVVFLDPTTLAIASTLEGIPGGANPHGMRAVSNQLGNVWFGVAGTSANRLTVFDSSHLIAQLPVTRPTAVFSVPNSFFMLAAAAAGDNALFTFSASSGNVSSVVPNVPNPIDAAAVSNGWVAAMGGMNSLWFNVSGTTTIVPGIPGIAALSVLDLPRPDPNSSEHLQAVLATSTDSNSLFVVYVPTAPPSRFGVTSAAAALALAPGSLASAYAATGVSQDFYASSIPLPLTLGGVTIRVGGTETFDASTGTWSYSSSGSVLAPLIFVGPNQINFQFPPSLMTSSLIPVQLKKADGTNLLSTVTPLPTAPAIFTLSMDGQGQAAALNQDSSPNFATKPAERGSVIQIFATGGGDTTPQLASGDAAPASGNPLVQINATPIVTIGGITANLKFSGMAPGWVGLWQIDAEVPAGVAPGSAVPLSVNIGGVQSNTVTIAVQ